MTTAINIKNNQGNLMGNYIDIIIEAQEILFSTDKTISVKDLAFCHRKKIFNIIDRVPMTSEELSNFTRGKIADYVIKRSFILFNRFDFDLEVQYKKIKGIIDIYDRLAHTIIEIKTCKSFDISKPKKWDEEQIKNYMAMSNCGNGAIIYSVSNFSRWKQFTIQLTLEERQERLKKLDSDSQRMLKVIDLKDPSLVDGIYLDNNLNWLCRHCPYLNECQNLRPDDAKNFPKKIFSRLTSVKNLTHTGSRETNQIKDHPILIEFTRNSGKVDEMGGEL